MASLHVVFFFRFMPISLDSRSAATAATNLGLRDESALRDRASKKKIEDFGGEVSALDMHMCLLRNHP